MRATIVPTDDGGGYRIDLDGASFDLRPYLDDRADDADATLPTLSLSAKLDRLIIREGHPITAVDATGYSRDGRWEVASFVGTVAGGEQVSLKLGARESGRDLVLTSNNAGEVLRTFDGVIREGHPITAVDATGYSRDGRWEVASFVGTVAGGEQVSLKLGARESGRDLVLTSNDAGEVLRTFDVFDNVIGGKLLLTADIDSRDSPAVGELRISDFTLINAPTLAKILSVASFTGVFNLLKGEGLPFENLIVPFTKSPDTLEIEDARSYGAALGLTIEGQIDLAGDVVDLNGTLVPAYTLNSVIGKVPLLGDLLVGPKGGGVFAATYRIAGPLDGPTIVVNPLAAFAPGVLRRLFFFSTGTGDVVPYDEEAPESAR